MQKKQDKMPPIPRETKAGRKIEVVLGDTSINDTEFDADMHKIEEIEQELEDCRVNFRWDKAHLSVVKKAALLKHMPYQRFIKEVVYAIALRELQQEQASPTLPSLSRPESGKTVVSAKPGYTGPTMTSRISSTPASIQPASISIEPASVSIQPALASDQPTAVSDLPTSVTGRSREAQLIDDILAMILEFKRASHSREDLSDVFTLLDESSSRAGIPWLWEHSTAHLPTDE